MDTVSLTNISTAMLDTKFDNVVDTKVGDGNWIKMECEELFMFYSHKCFEALLKSTKSSLEMLRKRCLLNSRRSSIGYSANTSEEDAKDNGMKHCFFLAYMILAIPNIEIQPTLDEIQAALNKAVQMILNVSKYVKRWGQTSENLSGRPKGIGFADGIKSHFKTIHDHKDVTKTVMMLTTSIKFYRSAILAHLVQQTTYSFLWEDDREAIIKEFLDQDPSLSDFRDVIEKFDSLIIEIELLPESVQVGAIVLFTEKLKLGLTEEVKSWKRLYAKQLNAVYKSKMAEIIAFISETLMKLNRNLQDLEDVRQVMSANESLRHMQIDIDMTLGPIEEAYSLFATCELPISKEELDTVDSIRYSFEKLLHTSTVAQGTLQELQPHFKEKLLVGVKQFNEDVDTYMTDYEEKGPMVEGVLPQEASDRLSAFQTFFDDLWTKFETYSAGENLFGMPKTEYPELLKVKKELAMLQKLYSLYNAVMFSINGYYDIMWAEVDIEKINVELQDFQTRIRKLPKGLKDWDAFLELQKKINNFNESCPILELMSNNAMKQRHWNRISAITGHEFKLDSDSVTLKNIMEAPLLEFKEDIEDVCIAAVKEKDIEAKLQQIVAEWTVQTLQFASFKVRGELLLRGQETLDIVTLMEDSLMMLSSLLSNSALNGGPVRSKQRFAMSAATGGLCQDFSFEIATPCRKAIGKSHEYKDQWHCKLVPIVLEQHRRQASSVIDWCRCGKCHIDYLAQLQEYICCQEEVAT
ncbi:Dynein heavy chain 8, axonemal [Lamellibrachia satsuma]|nr:Dynein heavy chain 8, axonemal [Lamellibrachia satsuma]